MRVRGRAPHAWPWHGLLLLVLAAGTFFRLAQLDAQMLIDDEWHAVRMLLGADYATIATHFGLADHSIPLTLAYRWLYLRDALDEWSMHLPLLACGLALLVAAPRLMRELPLPTQAIWCGLLAVSPTLVYFSRTARPYAFLALAGVLAFVAFRRWQAGGRHRGSWALLYAAATVLAGWAHVLALPFLLWPFVHHGVGALLATRDPVRRGPALRQLLALAVLAFAVLGTLAALLLPPLLADWGAMSAKAAVGTPDIGSLYRTLLMQFGLAQAWPAAPLLVLSAWGAWRLWRRDRELVALILGAALAGALLILLLRPAWIQHAPVLVRYAAPMLPWLLLFPAEGLSALVALVSRRAALAAPLAAAALAGLVLAGPLPEWYRVPNQFMEHAAFQFDYDHATNPYWTQLELGPVSPFYRELATRPPASVTLVETPARAVSNYMPDPWLQAIHRQNVKFALASPVCGMGDWDEYRPGPHGPHFRRVLPLGDILSGRERGGDYLVLRRHPWTLPRENFPWPTPWPDIEACARTIEESLGAPVWRDAEILVFRIPPWPPAR
ncbi:MAG: hypothetical protein J0H15_00225 [Xanthomonadales bacterium]|nr:hypothetical protein [Xanthomonadales bacterium]